MYEYMSATMDVYMWSIVYAGPKNEMKRLEEMFLDGSYSLFQEQTTAVDTVPSATDPLSHATTDDTVSDSVPPATTNDADSPSPKRAKQTRLKCPSQKRKRKIKG